MAIHKKLRLLEIIGVAAGLMIIASSRAGAYIDPGTGSYVLQSMVAGLLAGLFIIKTRWSQIKNAINRHLSNRKNDEK